VRVDVAVGVGDTVSGPDGQGLGSAVATCWVDVSRIPVGLLHETIEIATRQAGRDSRAIIVVVSDRETRYGSI